MGRVASFIHSPGVQRGSQQLRPKTVVQSSGFSGEGLFDELPKQTGCAESLDGMTRAEEVKQPLTEGGRVLA
jgi:hypothetical protein